MQQRGRMKKWQVYLLIIGGIAAIAALIMFHQPLIDHWQIVASIVTIVIGIAYIFTWVWLEDSRPHESNIQSIFRKILEFPLGVAVAAILSLLLTGIILILGQLEWLTDKIQVWQNYGPSIWLAWDLLTQWLYVAFASAFLVTLLPVNGERTKGRNAIFCALTLMIGSIWIVAQSNFMLWYEIVYVATIFIGVLNFVI